MTKQNLNLKNVAIMIACFAVCMTLAMVGCKKDKDDNPKLPEGMESVVMEGIVRDVDGVPISGVRVSTGTATTTTAADGKFSFDRTEVVESRAVIKFEKSGYFTLTRSGYKEDEMFIEAVLYPKGNSDISLKTDFNAKEGKLLAVSAGMKVKIGGSSIQRPNGSEYSGKVNADMLYLSPNNENFAGMMPGGDLAAIREDDSEVMLVSWGMTNVNLTDDSGNPLQLKGDAPAEITYPIPAGMENNPPPTIPLWHFDEVKGIWIEDGEATLQGNVYVGKVSHFSWSNLDVPEKRVTIRGLVIDCYEKPVQGITIKVEQTKTVTNSKGEFSIFVPENTPVTVIVSAYGKTTTINVPGQQGGTSYDTKTIQVPCPVTIKGKVVCGTNKDPVSYVNVDVGTVVVTTNSKGEYTAIIADHTPVTVTVKANGGSDSEDIPGQPEGTVYTVRDLVVPCGGDGPGTKTDIEKGSVKYSFYEESIMIYTFDEYGWRFRYDMSDKDETPENHFAYIINHLNKTTWSGSMIYDEETEEWVERWNDEVYDNSYEPGTAFTINETAMAPYQQPNNVTIAGKSCKHFIITSQGVSYEYATWNGLIMRMALTYQGETTIILLAIDATLDVPERAFTKTLVVDWF